MALGAFDMDDLPAVLGRLDDHLRLDGSFFWKTVAILWRHRMPAWPWFDAPGAIMAKEIGGQNI